MECRAVILSLVYVGFLPGVNQCVILFIILQQLFLTYQLEINKSFIHSFMIAIFATGIPIKFSFGWKGFFFLTEKITLTACLVISMLKTIFRR